MAKLFQYRFPRDGFLGGHSFGNLFLTAISDIAGSFDNGIMYASKVLAIRGRVLPATLQSVILKAKLVNGKTITGETKISRSSFRIEKLKISPQKPKPSPQVIESIRQADAIILGPGSLYTSIIPNLLIDGIISELKRAKCPKIYMSNIMTQHGETEGYQLSDHLNAILSHSASGVVDYVLANNGMIPNEIAKRYAKLNSYPIKIDKKNIYRINLVCEDLVSNREYAHHDPNKTANAVLKIISSFFESKMVAKN
jgi:uncharacterized cofD-like protein